MQNRPIRVLLIEDNPGDARLVREMLAEPGAARYELEWTERLRDGLELVAARLVDVALVDLSLPDSRADQTFASLKEMSEEAPVIVITGLVDEEAAARAVRGGAQDYLVKGRFDAELLARAIRYAIERWNFQKSLLAGEERYRELAESIRDIFFAMDEGLRYTYWNHASEQLTGIKSQDALGKHLYELFPAVKGTRVDLAYREALLTRKPIMLENEYALGGRKQVFELSVYPTREGISIFTRDITDRKKTEEALLYSEETARALINASRDSAFLIDAAGGVVAMNEIAAERMGRRVEEIVGAVIYDFLPLDMEVSRREKIAQVVREGKPLVFEDERAGIQFENSLYPVLDTGGKVSMIAIFARDITERMRMEVELRELNADLSAFAHTLSHDLKVPLANAYGYAQTLRSLCHDALDQDSRGWCDIVIEALARMNDIIEGMLNYSRLDGKGMAPREVELQPLVEAVLAELAAAGLPGTGEAAVLDELPAVRGDPARIRQVLYNLLSNAARYMGDNPEPRIEVGRLEIDGDQVVYVRDNGMGIDLADQGRIFELLERTEAAAGISGHGLGLAICRRAVESWGGRIWVESEPGRGSTFYFTLPEEPEGATLDGD